MKSQHDIMSTVEANKWFERNKDHLLNQKEYFDIHFLVQTLKNYINNESTILEMGSSFGKKTALLQQAFSCKATGIDPSIDAIEYGKKIYPNINLQKMNSSSTTFDDQEFDFIYWGFFMYLLDRDHVYKVTYETDRILKKGGFLAILDFEPMIPHKKEYHHQKGCYTYKNDYSKILLSSGHYTLVAKHSFSHDSNSFVKDHNQRISISLLYKEEDPYLVI